MSSENYKSLQKDDLVTLLVERDREIDKLQHLIAQSNKKLYGTKSEKASGLQRELFQADEPAVLPEPEVIEVPAHKRATSRTKKNFAGALEREEKVYDVADVHCPRCEREMPVIGKDTSEEVEYIPARVKIIEHVRLRRACNCCKEGVYAPALPRSAKPLERVAAGASLLSHICVSKYQDHIPLNRLEGMLLRDGVRVSSKSMCEWVAGVVKLLMPLYDRYRQELLVERYLQADETTIKVQDEECEKGKLHTGYFWTMLSPPTEERGARVLHFYAPSRVAEIPKELFKGFEGTLQTDLYAGYNEVCLPVTVNRLACLAHIRRKFIEAQPKAKADCTEILTIIARLYEVEAKARGKTADERYILRRKKAVPHLKKLYRTLKRIRRRAMPETALAAAVSYAWKQRRELLRYLRDGAFEIDNNMIERMMRPIALGRKNYLFAGSHDGARRAAVLYTFLSTCRLNNVNAFHWLTDVLKRIHEHPASRIHELLPHRWKPAVSADEALA